MILQGNHACFIWLEGIPSHMMGKDAMVAHPELRSPLTIPFLSQYKTSDFRFATPWDEKHRKILESPSLVIVAMLQWFQGTPTSGGLEAQLLGYDAWR